MSLSKNYPHQLALLLVALQTDKLPICEHLHDPTEKSLVATLMTYMNNRDFRTPITIARKTLGVQIRVKRSTLFNKLRSLKEKGLIEDVVGELPIRFSEKAIALMQTDWSKQADRWQENTIQKKQTFKIGNSTFPKDLVFLINRGISEKQMRGLLSEAKRAGLKLQEILSNFSEVLKKYDGKILFLVIRDILRKPKKYSITTTSGRSAEQLKSRLSTEEHALLRTAEDNANNILSPGEQLRQIDNEWLFTSEHSAWTPRPVQQDDITQLRKRMRQQVLAYKQTQPHWSLRHPINQIEMQLTGDGEAEYAKLQMADGKQTKVGWQVLYASLPAAARHYQGENKPHPRIGQQLLRRGIRYLVETVAGGIASLQVLSGNHSGRICTLPLAQLADPEIAWKGR